MPAGTDSSGQAQDGQRDSATGDLAGGNQGTLGTQSSAAGGGDYSLDTLPDGTFGGNSTAQTTGAMTTAERAAVLDEQLRRGYEKFDGLVLGEREHTQAEEQAAGLGGRDADQAGGGGGSDSQPQTLGGGQPAGPGGGVMTSSSAPPPPAGETFPPPEDIPSGRDDDVVARQLREAAMREPDPVLREALWEEYRKYTGISENQ
ncbi:MAG: hypothetical protein WD772_03100 [Pseudohongiellaceae bacterium]